MWQVAGVRIQWWRTVQWDYGWFLQSWSTSQGDVWDCREGRRFSWRGQLDAWQGGRGQLGTVWQVLACERRARWLSCGLVRVNRREGRRANGYKFLQFVCMRSSRVRANSDFVFGRRWAVCSRCGTVAISNKFANLCKESNKFYC